MPVHTIPLVSPLNDVPPYIHYHVLLCAGNPSSPSDVLDLSTFVLQVTNNESISVNHPITPALLTAGYSSPNFYLNPATNGVIFKVYGAPVFDGDHLVREDSYLGYMAGLHARVCDYAL